MVSTIPDPLLSRLVQLGLCIRDRVLAATATKRPDLARTVGRNQADFQFALDELAEKDLAAEAIEIFRGVGGLRLICEGSPEGSLILTEGTPAYVLIVDPVDGTRGLMHDKRSAFALLALAPEVNGVSLQDIICSAMVEIPTSRAREADVLAASRVGGLYCWSEHLERKTTRPFAPSPSEETDLRHGFATVVRYCSGAGTALGMFEDDFLRRVFAGEPEATQEVYEDQYISNGGQLHALITGRDRFVADLRPLFVTREGLPLTAAHPYDVCAALVAEKAGVIVTGPDGRALNAPLDTTSRVAWIAYASEVLRRNIEPHLYATLRDHELIDA